MTKTPMRGLFKKIRPPVKIHGGKYYLAHELRATFYDAAHSFSNPGIDVYASVFGGGFSDGLNIGAYGQVDIYNDADPVKANLFQQIRDDAPALRRILQNTQYTEENFLRAKDVIHAMKNDAAEDIAALPAELRTALASAYVIVSRFSRGGMGKSFAWSDRTRGGQPGDLNSWLTFLRDDFEMVVTRCAQLIVLCRPYDDVMKMLVDDAWNGKRVVVYCDPPYPHDTRTARKTYGRFEMRNVDPPDVKRKCSHEHFLECVKELDAVGARVAVSSYRTAMYDKALESFECDTYEMPNNSGQGKTKERRTEVVYRNFKR